MKTKNRILMVEHDPSDIDLIQREVHNAISNYETLVVETEAAFTEALHNFNPNLILSDYALPQFAGPAAFEIKEKLAPQTPFIFVSGTIGEENSIELIRNGVTDYALKDKLYTLPVKIKRALREAEIKVQKIKTEEELIKSEQRLARAQEVSHLGSWETNLTDMSVYWSDEIYRIFEIDSHNFKPTHQKFLNFVHSDDRQKVNQAFTDSINNHLSNNVIEHRIVTANNAIKYIEERWEISYTLKGEPLLASGTCHNISERKEAEEKLLQSEKEFRVLIENISDAIIVINESAKTIYQSPSAERITGFKFDEVSEKTVFEFVHPDDLESCMQFFQNVAATPAVPLQNQYRILHKQGHYIWIEGTITNFLHDEKLKAFIVNYRDITERKIAETEIKSLNESLEQKIKERTADLTEANKALEAFSYSVSHDLKSPIRSLLGFTQIIQKDYGHTFNPDMKELFGHIESNGKRMKAIVDDLLTLAKYGKEKLKPKVINMNNMISEVWNQISFTLPHHAKLEMVPLPKIAADPSMIQQVFINLLSNAVKYSSKKETPVIQVGFVAGDGTTTFFVKDNGAGFDMKHYNRLFGAFQRLHGMSEFEGTGIGLLIVKQIIERHAGTVWADGKTNEGATFYFSLPNIE